MSDGGGAASRTPDFFVFGSERGGTTLVSALLSAHPDAYTLNDSFLFLAAAEALGERRRGFVHRLAARTSWRCRDLLRRIGPLRALLFRARVAVTGGYRPAIPGLEDLPGPDAPLSAPDARAVLRRLRERHRQFQPDERSESFLLEYQRRLEASPVRAELVRGGRPLAEWLGVLFSELVPPDQRARARLGEKTPRHVYCAPWISELCPRAAWVTVVRNPVSTVASLVPRMNGDLEGAIAKYLSFHADRCAALYDPGQSLVVRFEDVVRAPTETLTTVHRHLGLEPHQTTAPADSTRAGYIGGAIDPERERARVAAFPAHARHRVLEACTAVVERHYPDLEQLL